MTASAGVAILGGGQLGRMLALAAHRLGLRVRLFDPSPDACAATVAECLIAPWNNHAALEQLAAGMTVATVEQDHVPLPTATALAGLLPLQPGTGMLARLQDRLSQKMLLDRLGLATAPWHPVGSPADLADAAAQVGLPLVLKTRRGGFDGRGLTVVREADDLVDAWHRLGSRPCIAESLIAFDDEASLVMARGLDGAWAAWPLVRNRHRDGILVESVAPHPLAPQLQAQAETIGRRLAEALDQVGVAAIEFFRRGDELIINEISPRVHNTGHWTLDGAVTDQFEQHLRAICGLPLGSTAVRGVSLMCNILGQQPDPAALLELPDTHLHRYGKADRPGRKIGHVTSLLPDHATVADRLAVLRQRLALPATTDPLPT